MKANRSDAMSRALKVTLVLAAFAPIIQAAPSTSPRPAEVFNNTSQAKPGRAATNALPFFKSRAHAAKPSCANPRGIRFNVRCYFRVTNAIDGGRDNEVEMYGNVSFNGQSVWNVEKGNAISAVRDLKKEIPVGERTIDVLFNRSTMSKLKIDGFLRDHDAGSEMGGGDAMWNPSRRTLVLDIKKVYDGDARLRPYGMYISQGDRDRESADLIFIITKVSDIP